VELHVTLKGKLEMFEVHLEAGAAADGNKIGELGLLPEALISSVVRGERIIAALNESPRGGGTGPLPPARPIRRT
jgi:hypothetical protein